jgi:hypothetical protein
MGNHEESIHETGRIKHPLTVADIIKTAHKTLTRISLAGIRMN